MRNFTKEEIDILSEAENVFMTSVYHKFKRDTSRALNERVADLYEKASGKSVNRNWSCCHCVMELYKAAGRLYFESKKEIEEKPVEEKPVEKPKIEKKIIETKKVGRPKKK